MANRANVEYVTDNRDQLWAEAVWRYKAGEIWWFDAAVIHMAEDEQTQRMIVDAWEDRISSFVSDRSVTSVSEIMTSLLHIPYEEYSNSIKTRVGDTMTKLGWRTERPSRGGQRRYVLIRKELALDDPKCQKELEKTWEFIGKVGKDGG